MRTVQGKRVEILVSCEKLREVLEPLAVLRASAVAGDDPRRAYKTVPTAVGKALERAGLTMELMDLIEIQITGSARYLENNIYKGYNNEIRKYHFREKEAHRNHNF